MNRRRFLQAAASLPLAFSVAGGIISPAQAESSPFDRSIVRQMARDTAAKPFKAPDTKLPDNLKNLDYDHYRGNIARTIEDRIAGSLNRQKK